MARRVREAKQDSRADSNLRAWGTETLAPRLWQLREATDASASNYRAESLFPGYVFAHFDASQLYANVRLTRRVHSVVGFGESATPVDDDVIALIRGRVQDDGLIHEDESEPGDLVAIVDGPLRSLSGIFDRAMTGGERVCIVLNTIGCAVRVSRGQIRRIG